MLMLREESVIQLLRMRLWLVEKQKQIVPQRRLLMRLLLLLQHVPTLL